jgi:hypothetical protein
VLDIIFKWANVKLNESSNTKLLVSLFDFFANLLTFAHKTAYCLEDFEAAVLLGTLCEKVGLGNKILVDKIKKLIKMCYDVMETKNVYRIIIDKGVKSKNLKSVAENLDEVNEYIKTNGIESISTKDFALFLVCVDSSDKNVRENALRVFAEAYQLMGEDIWRPMKGVPLKVKGLLEQRFKQVSKKNPLSHSINSSGKAPSSNKKDLNLSMGAAVKRSTMNPKQAMGLKFNKPSDYVEKKAEPERSSEGSADLDRQEVVEQMGSMAIQKDEEMKVEPPKQQDGDVEMQDDSGVIQPKHSQKLEGQPQENEDKNVPDLDELLNNAEDQLETDPVLKKQTEFIMHHISQLKIGDLLKRVDSLVALNELISAAGGNIGDQQLSQD